MSTQSKSHFWSASTWKARLKRGNSAQSTTSTFDEFVSAHSSMRTDQTAQTNAAEDLTEEQTERLSQYSPSVYSKEEDVRSPVLPPSDDKKEDLAEYYLVSLPCQLLSLTSPLLKICFKMIFQGLTDTK